MVQSRRLGCEPSKTFGEPGPGAGHRDRAFCGCIWGVFNCNWNRHRCDWSVCSCNGGVLSGRNAGCGCSRGFFNCGSAGCSGSRGNIHCDWSGCDCGRGGRSCKWVSCNGKKQRFCETSILSAIQWLRLTRSRTITSRYQQTVNRLEGTLNNLTICLIFLRQVPAIPKVR